MTGLMAGVFRGFQRSNRPLSSYLAQRYTSPALAEVGRMTLDELADPDAVVERIVAEQRSAPPSIGQGRFTGAGPGEHRPDEASSVSRRTVRQRVRYLVDADIAALGYWPDEDNEAGEEGERHQGGELVAVDDDVAFAERASGARAEYDADLRDYRARVESQPWVIAAGDGPTLARGLHTYRRVPRSR